MSSEPEESETAKERTENAAEERLKKQKEIHPLLAKMHAKYFVRVLNILPGALSKLDSNRYACLLADASCPHINGPLLLFSIE